MFSKKEIKEFVVKLGNKWFFPDFSNKITWYVIILGAAIVATPTPLKLIFYNWLIDSFNLNSGMHLTLPELTSDSADYWLGFSLILLALLHNVISKWILLHNRLFEKRDNERLIEVDRKLFEEFLKTFPSNSSSLCLLQEHDFGASFKRDSLREIDAFVYGWNNTEKQFLTDELETLRSEFWRKCDAFTWLLAEKSGPTAVGLQCVVPDRVRDDWDWPDWVNKNIDEVNRAAHELAAMHQEFIKAARRILKC